MTNNPLAASTLESFASFGALLLYLRRRARLRQRDLAEAVGYSEAQIGRLEHNQRLPDIATVLAHFIPALGLTNEPELAAQLVALAHTARLNDPALGTEATAGAQGNTYNLGANTDAFAEHLPQPGTPLVGRSAELEQLRRLLEQPDDRCITCTGVGGVGKTRLALEAIRRYGPDFRHGAYSVALAEVPTVNLLVPTIARALGVSLALSGDPLRVLGAHLHDKHIVLLLDNMEHLVEGAELLAVLLRSAPHVRLLITSCERLGLRNEVVVQVMGLPVPAKRADGPDNPAGSEAVHLFLCTARRTLPGFLPTAADLCTIARICIMVEGHPLAIELAAAWVALLSLDEIAQELHLTLAQLATRLRDVPLRHRSLHAAFAHSWVLLTPEEQLALRRLSVFRGSFSREAAAVILAVRFDVTGASETAETPARAVLTTLSALADKSMLKRIGAADESRYGLHELIRRYAAEQQAAYPDEAMAVVAAHGRFYLGLLAANEQALRSSAQAQVSAALNSELDNLRAAVTWAAHAGEVEVLRAAFPALRDLIEWRYALHDGLELFQAIAEPLAIQTPAVDQAPTHRGVRALALSAAGWFAYNLGRPDEALNLLEQAEVITRDLDDRLVYGNVAWVRGSLAGRLGDAQQGRRWLLQALEAFTDVGDAWCVARTLYALAQLAQEQGDYAMAQALLVASRQRIRPLGSPQAAALILGRLGSVEARLGRYSQAERFLQESLLAFSAVHDRRGMAMVLFHLGNVAQQRLAHREAHYFLHESGQLFSAIGDRYSAADAFAHAGHSALEAHDGHAARQAFAEVRSMISTTEVVAVTLSIITCHAALLLATDQAECAVEALTMALYHPVSSQDTRDRATHLLKRAETTLAPSVFRRAQARGRIATPEL